MTHYRVRSLHNRKHDACIDLFQKLNPDYPPNLVIPHTHKCLWCGKPAPVYEEWRANHKEACMDAYLLKHDPMLLLSLQLEEL